MVNIKNRLRLVAALTALGIMLIVVGMHLSKSISGGYAASIETDKYPTVSPKPETDALRVCDMIRVGDDPDYPPHLKDVREDCIAVVTLNESRCKNSYYCMQIAKLKKDPSICERLPKDEFEEGDSIGQHFEQNFCYKEVALSLNDPRVCDRIVMENDTDASDDTDVELLGRIILASCRAYSANDSMLCGGIPTDGRGLSYKTGCLMDFAEKRGDTSLCDMIGDDGEGGDKPFCYLIVAAKNRDRNICNTDEIAGWSKWSGYKFDCLAILDNPRWCEEFNAGTMEAEQRRSWCYELSARYRKEPDLCRNTSSLYNQECLTLTAIEIAHGV